MIFWFLVGFPCDCNQNVGISVYENSNSLFDLRRIRIYNQKLINNSHDCLKTMLVFSSIL